MAGVKEQSLQCRFCRHNILAAQIDRDVATAGFEQRFNRMEEIIGDLTRIIGKTHVKASNTEFLIVQLQMASESWEQKYKMLEEKNDELSRRLMALEQSGLPWLAVDKPLLIKTTRLQSLTK
ncbi:hypothetical protein [Peribacillus sp. SCS-155]|uniref:hypothetical protein n=1 Tax=Peribacillus sedimenti TaxID=3115297 RepID=UPI003905A4D9